MQDSVIFNQICGRQGYENVFSCQPVTCNTKCIKQLAEASEAQDLQTPHETEGGTHFTRL